MPEGTEQKKAPSTDIIERLLAKGKKNGGSLTFGEIIDALQKQDMSPDEMDDMYQRFSDEGVEIVDDVATDERAEDEKPEKEEEVEIDLTVPEGISLDDPVRMYRTRPPPHGRGGSRPRPAHGGRRRGGTAPPRGGQSAPRRQHRQAVRRTRDALSRPHSGGQSWIIEGGRKIRLQQGL